MCFKVVKQYSIIRLNQVNYRLGRVAFVSAALNVAIAGLLSLLHDKIVNVHGNPTMSPNAKLHLHHDFVFCYV